MLMIRIQLQANWPVSLFRLLPAFPLAIEAIGGTSVIRLRRFNIVLTSGRRFEIEPFELVELHLHGGPSGKASCMMEIEDMAAWDSTVALHRSIAKNVFLQPRHTWNAEYIADMRRTSTAEVRRTLFSEGAALTEICRTQRLMRMLFEVNSEQVTAESWRSRIGWPSRCDLEASFHDWFGLPWHAVRRLARDGGRDIQ